MRLEQREVDRSPGDIRPRRPASPTRMWTRVDACYWGEFLQIDCGRSFSTAGYRSAYDWLARPFLLISAAGAEQLRVRRSQTLV